MSKKDVLGWFGENNQALSVEKILLVLCIALIISAVIFITYRITYTGVSYNARFNASNMAMVIITAVIMLMIGSNIAISLGMVGALSIVRFRTAIKDPQDIVYIFWAIVEGLCVGSGSYPLAFISTLFLAAVLTALCFYTRSSNKYLIIVRGGLDLSKEDLSKALSSMFSKTKIRAINNREDSCELIVEVSVKGELDITGVDALKEVKGVKSANWILERGGNVG